MTTKDELLQENLHYRFSGRKKGEIYPDTKILIKDSKTDDIRSVWGWELINQTLTNIATLKSFSYQSVLIKNNVYDKDNPDDRELWIEHNGVAGLVVERISHESFEGGWNFAEKQGKEWNEITIESNNGDMFIDQKKKMDKLFFTMVRQKVIDVPYQATREKRGHGMAVSVMHFKEAYKEALLKTDMKSDSIKKYWESLEKPRKSTETQPVLLQVFGPSGAKRIKTSANKEMLKVKDGYEIPAEYYDEQGLIDFVNIKIHSTRGGPQTYKVHWSRCLFLVGENALKKCFDDLVNLVWNHFSFADFANRRGAFIGIKNSDVAMTLADMIKELEYIRNAQTRGCIILNEGKDMIDVPARTSAVNIAEAIDKNILALAADSYLPESQLVGAQAGQMSSARSDQMKYYPLLRKQQEDFMKQMMMELIKIMKPELFDLDMDWTIKFDMDFNLSDMEQADLDTKLIGIKLSKVQLYKQLAWTIGEIAEGIGEKMPDNLFWRNTVLLAYELNLAKLQASPIEFRFKGEPGEEEKNLPPPTPTPIEGETTPIPPPIPTPEVSAPMPITSMDAINRKLGIEKQAVTDLVLDNVDIFYMIQKIFERTGVADAGELSEFSRKNKLSPKTTRKLRDGEGTSITTVKKGLSGVIKEIAKINEEEVKLKSLIDLAKNKKIDGELPKHE